MTHPHRPAARTALALLAATTSVLPIALWATPAQAAGPLTFNATPCQVSLSGDGYDELTIYRTDPFGTHYLLAASYQQSSVTVDYGAWLVADGDTVAMSAVAEIDNQVVATAGPVDIGACQTGASIHIDAVDVGVPPTPDDGTYKVWVGKCAIGTTPAAWAITASDPEVVVPVPPDVEYCPSTDHLGPSEPAAVDAEPNRFSVPPGGQADVVVTGEWAAQHVVLRHAAGANPGLAPSTEYTWTATGGGTDPADGECWLDDPSEIDCTDQARIRDGGTFEVTMTGSPGWTLLTTSFDESDCVTVPDPFYGTACALDLVYAGPGGPSGPAAPQSPSAEPLCDPAASSPFTDVNPATTHGANVVCAADRGLVVGGPGGLPSTQFGPTLTSSRAQLATLVRNLLVEAGVVLPQGAPDAFADDEGSVHETSIDVLRAMGVIGGNGESGSSFLPSRAATRSEIASFLHRAHTAIAGSPLPAGPDAFTDDEGDPAEEAINALAAAGVLSGKAPGTFDPTGTVTREQIASLFVRLLAVASGA